MASLSDADLRLKLSERESQERILKAQRRLLALRLQLGGLIGGPELGPPLCVLFEGWDASGKGGPATATGPKVAGSRPVVRLSEGSVGRPRVARRRLW